MRNWSCYHLILLSAFVLFSSSLTTYTADWKSLDSRPLPQWFDEAKFGIFIHWGVFSVPSFVNEWFWYEWQGTSPDPRVWLYMQKYYRADASYADFAEHFHAEFFDPKHWADLFKASGARYVVLTAKHHEGFCNWPSPTSWNWNSKDIGPKKDLVGDLALAIRNRTNLEFGLYHSMFEWFNPLYLDDKLSNYTKQRFVDAKTMPELYDLVEKYRPSVIWSDGAPATSDYWKAREFLAWLYNDSPVRDYVVVNDRWGADAECQHGDFWNCQDRFHPDKLMNHKWESCVTLDKSSWGFRREAILKDYLTVQEVLEVLVDTVVFGGNLLLNVGPTSWGTIAPIFEERLLSIGEWLKVNGEAIFNTTPWVTQRDPKCPKLWYNMEKIKNRLNETGEPFVYALFSVWPKNDSGILLSAVKNASRVILLENFDREGQNLTFFTTEDGLKIQLPKQPPKDAPFPSVWTLRISSAQAFGINT